MGASSRVLHVLSSLDEAYGGPLRLVLDLSARAEGLGLESELIGIGEVKLRDNPLPPGRVHAVRSGFLDGYAYSPALRAWLRQNLNRFDGAVIHGAWTYAGWAAAVELRAAKVPYAYFPHGMLERWAVGGQGRMKQAKKLLYWKFRESQVCRGACCTFFTTRREMQLAAVPIPEPRRILRPYGIVREPAQIDKPQNASLSQQSGHNVALFLGRLHPKKNVDLLIKAWDEACMPEAWRLVLAGSGSPPYERELRQIVRDRGLEMFIQFAGFVSGVDKQYLLQRADWFLLPSSQENFGVAVLEAVQHGCAVAISDQVYLAESFRRDSEILPVDFDAWVQFFRGRMRNAEWRDQVSSRDRTHLMETYSMDVVVQQWTDTFRTIFPKRIGRRVEP